jgi:hypothetical protein
MVAQVNVCVKKTIEELRRERARPYLEIEENKDKFEVAKKHAEKLIEEKKILKAGNRKLDKSILIFNLPDAYTCPGASIGCLRFCYAKPSKSNNPKSTALARYARYLITQRPDFADIIVNELKRKRACVVRIHESGDFYSVEYFRKWLEVARRLPAKTFYAYTKSWFIANHLNELPDNFIIIFSLDKTNFYLFKGLISRIAEARAKGKRVGISYVNTHTEEDEAKINEIGKFLKTYVCPATVPDKTKHGICGRECKYCSTNPQTVIFNVH